MRIGLFIPWDVDMLFPEVGVATLELLAGGNPKVAGSNPVIEMLNKARPSARGDCD